jgi:hypothetical protein
MALVVQHTDPVNALMLIVIWARLERYAKRVNRVENELIDVN